MFIAESGTSNDKCSEIYPGKTAFSEIETTNIKNFVETLDPVPILGKYAYVTGTCSSWRFLQDNCVQIFCELFCPSIF
jgi:hypothetical protein